MVRLDVTPGYKTPDEAMTEDPISDLADAITSHLFSDLCGTDACEADMEHLRSMIYKKLNSELFHSKSTAPLLLAKGRNVYTEKYFRMRTAIFINYLAGLYGRSAADILNAAKFGIYVTLVTAHYQRSLLSRRQRESLLFSYAEVRQLVMSFRATNRDN